MVTESGAKLQRQTTSKVADIIGTKKSVVTSQKEESTDARAENIASNPFYKILADQAIQPEDKANHIAAALSNVSNEEESKTAINNLEQVKEYLQLQRENQASKIIELSDTNVIARLQQVYTDMNSGLLDFQEDLKPILDIVDAMHIVRKEGKTNELFAEIRKDRQSETEFNAKRDLVRQKFDSTKLEIDSLRRDNSQLAEEKSFFGFGGTSKEARQQIALNDLRIEELTTELGVIEAELNSLISATPVSETDNSEYGNAKKTIRQMIDLNADSHRENQKKVVEKATNFVKTSKSSLGAIREHIVGMNGQIDKLSNSNYVMTSSYAILGEGIKEAAKSVNEKRSSVSSEIEGGSMITKLAKEKELRLIDGHATMLQNSATDTELTFADLSNQASRIKTMSDANVNQMEKVKKLHVTGVASVADQLSVVLQAVGQAALGESSAIAKDTLSQMHEITNEISFKESMRVAHMSGEVNEDIVKAFEDLAAYGEITRAATEVTRTSVTEMRENLTALNEAANSLQEDLKVQAAVYSETVSEEKKQAEAANKSATTVEPADTLFKI